MALRRLARVVVVLTAVALALLGAAPHAVAIAHPTVVTLTFDDSDADQLAAGQTLANVGVAATFYTVTGWVGAPGYLTRGQLGTLAAQGHEIGGHTVTHPDLIQIAPTEAQAQICNDRATLDAWGFHPVSFAYPFSDANASVEQAARQCGYTTARGLGDVRSAFGCTACVRAETSPPPDPAYLRAPDQVDGRWTLANLKSQVTGAVNASGGWVILTFHHVCAPVGTASCPADQSISPTVFNQFVTWLAAYRSNAANLTTVRTVDQQVRSYLGSGYPDYSPPSAVAPRPPAAPGVNALTNSSVEAADSFTGFPACFQPGGWGTNNATWSTTSAARTGGVAEQLALSGYASGDAKLLPTLDLVTCSPSVVLGHAYRVSAWFRSTGVTQLALYYRDASGAWFYWTSGPWLAASPQWQEAALVAPPAPPTATGMSFGLALIANGTLTTDDYAVVDTTGTSPAVTAATVTPTPTTRPTVDAATARTTPHSHGAPYLPGAARLRPGTRIAPPELTRVGRG